MNDPWFLDEKFDLQMSYITRVYTVLVDDRTVLSFLCQQLKEETGAPEHRLVLDYVSYQPHFWVSYQRGLQASEGKDTQSLGDQYFSPLQMKLCNPASTECKHLFLSDHLLSLLLRRYYPQVFGHLHWSCGSGSRGGVTH